MDDLMRIGDFARLGGVSVKTLRFYDDQGLLAPAYVDPQTGYRYYTAAQTLRLAMITNLRLVDFSIAEIAAVLSGNTVFDLTTALAEKKRSIVAARDELERKSELADILARALQYDDNDAAPPSFKLSPIDDQLVYSVDRRVVCLGDPVTELFETAEASIAPWRAERAPLLLFHDPPTTPQNIHIEICLPVNDNAAGRDGVKRLPGAALACALVFAGGYHQTTALFEKMTDWLARAAFAPCGPLREVYHRFGADEDGYELPQRFTAGPRETFLTELQLPIKPLHTAQGETP